MTGAPFRVARGCTFWIPGTGPAHDADRAHLFITLTAPDANDEVLLVPVCSEHSKCDTTCRLGAGDHGFIRHPSYVAYHKLGVYLAARIEAGVATGAVEFRGMIDERVFAFVCAGVDISRQSAPRMKQFYAERTR